MFECEVDGCPNLIGGRNHNHWCNSHRHMNEKYGTPTPFIPCHDCKNDYKFTTSLGRGKSQLCPKCLSLREQFGHLVTSNTMINHGLTKTEFIKMVIKQEFKCAICRETPKKFYIDHDHSCCPKSKSCGKCVRSALCQRCNIIVGHVENNGHLIKAAFSYVGQRDWEPWEI